MAVYPCDIKPHRYPQPQQSIYYTLVQGDVVVTYKQRLCPKHFREMAVYIQEKMAMVDEASQVSRYCEWCEELRDSSVYAKVFPAKAEMQQFALDLCATHSEELANALEIRNGTAM